METELDRIVAEMIDIFLKVEFKWSDLELRKPSIINTKRESGLIYQKDG